MLINDDTFEAELKRKPPSRRELSLLRCAARVALCAAAAALCAATSGCALFQGNQLKEVNDSQLNWLMVRYHPAAQGAKPCSLNIVGVGSVEFRQGRSPLVFNSFSQDVDNPLWGDIVEEKLGVTPAQARWMMQLFVDAGLPDEANRMGKLNMDEREDASAGIAIISAKLNGKTFRVRTNNPELTGVVDAIIDAIVSNGGFR